MPCIDKLECFSAGISAKSSKFSFVIHRGSFLFNPLLIRIILFFYYNYFVAEKKRREEMSTEKYDELTDLISLAEKERQNILDTQNIEYIRKVMELPLGEKFVDEALKEKVTQLLVLIKEINLGNDKLLPDQQMAIKDRVDPLNQYTDDLSKLLKFSIDYDIEAIKKDADQRFELKHPEIIGELVEQGIKMFENLLSRSLDQTLNSEEINAFLTMREHIEARISGYSENGYEDLPSNIQKRVVKLDRYVDSANDLLSEALEKTTVSNESPVDTSFSGTFFIQESQPNIGELLKNAHAALNSANSGTNEENVKENLLRAFELQKEINNYNANHVLRKEQGDSLQRLNQSLTDSSLQTSLLFTFDLNEIRKSAGIEGNILQDAFFDNCKDILNSYHPKSETNQGKINDLIADIEQIKQGTDDFDTKVRETAKACWNTYRDIYGSSKKIIGKHLGSEALKGIRAVFKEAAGGTGTDKLLKANRSEQLENTFLQYAQDRVSETTQEEQPHHGFGGGA